jgi:hypothetical protein
LPCLALEVERLPAKTLKPSDGRIIVEIGRGLKRWEIHQVWWQPEVFHEAGGGAATRVGGSPPKSEGTAKGALGQ